MKLCVKVDESLKGLDDVEEFIDGVIEIHLLSKEVDISKYAKFPKIIFHASGHAYELGDIVESDEQKLVIKNLLKQMDKTKHSLLLHCGWRGHTKNEELIEYLWEIYNEYEVPIILEGTIDILDRDRAVEIVNTMNHPDIRLCIDMSHVRAIKNMGEDIKDYYSEIRKIDHIHFSYSSNKDGFIDMSTHGVPHPNMLTVLFDAFILNRYNTKDATICPEVSESDYSTRKNQHEEILKMKKAGLFTKETFNSKDLEERANNIYNSLPDSQKEFLEGNTSLERVLYYMERYVID